MNERFITATVVPLQRNGFHIGFAHDFKNGSALCLDFIVVVFVFARVLDDLCDVAADRGIIDGESIVARDLFDTRIMGLLTPRPSCVIKKFKALYKGSPKMATDYFYSLSIDSNYIRADRIKRDLKWQVESEYGMIDISVNLSKPEKDPKAIAAAKNLPQTDYPKCALCHENEGYAGTLTKPARHTLRQIPFTMGGEGWYLQYSPYVYYNEHCIALSEKHEPMKIERATFEKLLGFVTEFPHYFIGSWAARYFRTTICKAADTSFLWSLQKLKKRSPSPATRG